MSGLAPLSLGHDSDANNDPKRNNTKPLAYNP